MNAHVLALDKQRKQIEDEIEMLVADLTSPGLNGEPPAGIKGTLVDAEGFPRADVDLYAVRHKRHRLNCLQNDFKQVMREVEAALMGGSGGVASSAVGVSAAAAVAAASPAAVASAPGAGSVASIFADAGMQVTADGEVVSATHGNADHGEQDGGGTPVETDRPAAPFALVDDVADGGPARAAGLRVGDLIVRFGHIDASNHRNLQAVGELVAAHIQQPVTAK
eukprot:g1256.t1